MTNSFFRKSLRSGRRLPSAFAASLGQRVLAASRHLDPATLSEHKRRNLLHTLFLLCGIGLVLAIAAAMLIGFWGVILVIVGVAIAAMAGPRIPPEAVMRLYRGAQLPPGTSQISNLVDQLAARAELPARPKVYVIPSATLNAFATGTPEQSAIGITEGLMRSLSLRELAGVLAHEVAHIRNQDLWVMGIADLMTRLVQPMSYVAIFLVLANVIGSFSGEPAWSWWGIALLYLAPAISSLMQLGLSRTREFEADLEGALLTNDPMGLAAALRRVDRYTGRFWEDVALPVPGRRVPQPCLLRTHPPTEERIERLLALRPEQQTPPMIIIDEPMISPVGFGPSEIKPRYRWPVGLWY